MNQTSLKTFVFLFLLATSQSYAIFGIGVHLVSPTSTVTSSKSSSGPFLVERTKTNNYGLGTKIWVDFLPVVDIEATANFYFSQYKGSLGIILPNDTGSSSKDIPYLGYDIDFSVLYPLLTFPPLFKVLKIYVGAGVTISGGTPTLNTEIIQQSANTVGAGSTEDITSKTVAGTTLSKIAQSILTETAENAIKEFSNTTLGAHAIFGANLTLPAIPIYLYANTKLWLYKNRKGIDKSPFAFELGAAFGF